jgi:hypothetical protein
MLAEGPRIDATMLPKVRRRVDQQVNILCRLCRCADQG